MKTLTLLMILLASTAWAGGEKMEIREEEYIFHWADCVKCKGRLYNALEEILKYVESSTGYGSNTLEYVPPSEQLRRNADRMDRRDAAIEKARKTLEECKP